MDDQKTSSNQRAEVDRRLITAALDGDPKAYDELMRKYRKSVYYLILKMVRNDDDAADITQESFAKAFNNLAHFDPKFAFSTWLFRIATNASIDFIRRRKLQTLSISSPVSTEDGSMMALQIEDEGLIPDESFLRQQRHDFLQVAIKRLDDRYRRLVELRYFQEYSYEEVAKELDLPLGTVKAQLHRARELLNKELEKIQKNL